MKHNHLVIKFDKRFKKGYIKQTGNELRGHPDTLDMQRMSVPANAPMELQLNPPIVVSAELAKKLKNSKVQ